MLKYVKPLFSPYGILLYMDFTQRRFVYVILTSEPWLYK